MSTQSDAVALYRQRLRDHSAQLLNVGVDAPWAEVRQALLASVEAADYVPDLHFDVARRVLQNPACEERAVMSGIYEASLREEIEGAAESWFRMSLIERQARWRQLAQAARNYPRLHVWLQRLWPAMTLEAPLDGRDHNRSNIDELTALCREEAVARPIAAAVRRHTWLEQSEIAETARVQAVKEIKRQSQQLAQLAPDCVKLLGQTHAQFRRLARWHAWRSSPTIKLRTSWSMIGVVVASVVFVAFVAFRVQSESSRRPALPRAVKIQPTAEQLVMEAVRAGRTREYRIVPDADGFGEHLEKVEKPVEPPPPPTEAEKRFSERIGRMWEQYKAEQQAKESMSGETSGAEPSLADPTTAPQESNINAPSEDFRNESENTSIVDPEAAAIIDGLIPDENAPPPAEE